MKLNKGEFHDEANVKIGTTTVKISSEVDFLSFQLRLQVGQHMICVMLLLSVGGKSRNIIDKFKVLHEQQIVFCRRTGLNKHSSIKGN